jgi:hypothetical protein
MMGVGFIAKELMMASTVGTDFVILADSVAREQDVEDAVDAVSAVDRCCR